MLKATYLKQFKPFTIWIVLLLLCCVRLLLNIYSFLKLFLCIFVVFCILNIYNNLMQKLRIIPSFSERRIFMGIVRFYLNFKPIKPFTTATFNILYILEIYLKSDFDVCRD